MAMTIAVGTSSAMVAATTLMGLIGHTISVDLNIINTLPLGIFAVIGGIIGGKFALQTKPKDLKKIFACTTLAAAALIFINAFLT